MMKSFAFSAAAFLYNSMHNFTFAKTEMKT
jgi:hypothetical protein